MARTCLAAKVAVPGVFPFIYPGQSGRGKGNHLNQKVSTLGLVGREAYSALQELARLGPVSLPKKLSILLPDTRGGIVTLKSNLLLPKNKHLLRGVNIVEAPDYFDALLVASAGDDHTGGDNYGDSEVDYNGDSWEDNENGVEGGGSGGGGDGDESDSSGCGGDGDESDSSGGGGGGGGGGGRGGGGGPIPSLQQQLRFCPYRNPHFFTDKELYQVYITKSNTHYF